jgi:hypothetical protein
MIAPKRLRVHDPDRVTQLLLEAARSESPGRQRLLRIASAAVGVGATATGKAAATAALVSASPAIGMSATSVAVVLKWIGVGALGGMMVSAAAAEISLETPPALDHPPAHQGAPLSAMPVADAPKRVSASNPLPEPRISHQSGQRLNRGNGSLAPPASTLAKRLTDPTDRSQRAPIPGASGSRHFSETESRPKGAPAAANEPERIPSAAERALREEVAALALAKSALNRGEAAAALEAVRVYWLRYPQGRLAPEAEFIEMEAALALGDLQRAVRVAGQLATGTSPSSERAREILRGR